MLKVLVTIDIARLKIMQQNEASFLHMYAKSCVTQSRILLIMYYQLYLL